MKSNSLQTLSANDLTTVAGGNWIADFFWNRSDAKAAQDAALQGVSPAPRGDTAGDTHDVIRRLGA